MAFEPATFLARALQEGRRYGEDPYVFLRELAQNARDARATEIRVKTDAGPTQRIVFWDDGDGMTFAHARDYLFKLYASSKEKDRQAAGHFGVGFWSILQWRPDRIVIESRSATDAWGVVMDAGLSRADRIECGITSKTGTRVTLERRAPQGEAADGHAFAAHARERLRSYCRYLRRVGGKQRNERLPVIIDGERIDEDMHLDGPLVLRFESHAASGVAGLGPAPRVELYARGLLVKRTSFLEELVFGRRVPSQPQNVGGLSPVVLLNSDDLDVVLSRQAPVQSRALRRVVRLGQARVRRLLRQVIDRACPRPWHERLRDGLAGLLRGIGGIRVLAVVCIWLLVLGSVVALVTLGHGSGSDAELDAGDDAARVSNRATVAAPSDATSQPQLLLNDVAPVPSGSADVRPYANITGYRGARVDVPTLRNDPRWGLTYEGPAELLFKSLTLSRYDPDRGLLRGDVGPPRPYPPYNCKPGRDCIRVSLRLADASGSLSLPLPTGYRLDARSLRLDGRRPAHKPMTNGAGEAMLELGEAVSGTLTFEAGPARQPRPERPVAASPLPTELRRRLERLRRGGRHGRARAITALVREEIAYDTTKDVAQAFSDAQGLWLERVFAVGAGDCDVKNGVNVLALRSIGIPARMAVGIPARAGLAGPGLHAWTEYYAQGRWWSIDASGRSTRPPTVGRAASGESTRNVVARAATLVATAASRPAVPMAGPTWLAPVRPWLGHNGLFLAAVVAGGVLLVVVLLLLLLSRRLVSEQLVVAEGDGVEARALARILKDALSRPAAWRQTNQLWHRPLLPTLRGRRMSVADAITRAIDGALWVSRRHTSLATEAAAAGTPVLDGADPIFGEVIAALGRGVDLDSLAALQPTSDGDERLTPLIVAVNRFLADAGVGVSCWVCPGLRDASMADVDLSGLELPRDSKWPRRFIAINPESGSVRARAELVRRSGARGIFVFVDWLLDRSSLLSERANFLRHHAAKAVIGAGARRVSNTSEPRPLASGQAAK